jgi:uncharacterized alpha/beta hydrolase family protein
MRRLAIIAMLAMLASLLAAGTAIGSDILQERDVAMPAGNHHISGTLTVPTDRSHTPYPAVLMHGFGGQKDDVGDLGSR